ncbi:MAG: oxidoreductase [Bacteriovoracaceae bacterium]|nr:oxidoreductase [Bacteriovoracaceae bacterium]
MAGLQPPVSEKDHIQGNENAPVTLVEYGDYECPYCGMAYPMIKKVQRHFADDLRFVFRNFPLSESHPHAVQAAEATEAAGLRGKFWEMHDTLYENQDALETDDIFLYSERIGLKLDQFKKDLSNKDVILKVQSDFKSGVRSGVNGTPNYFINGFKYEGDNLTEAITKILSVVRG